MRFMCVPALCLSIALTTIGLTTIGARSAAEAGDKPTKNLIEVATAVGTFKTLVKALGDADLAKTLEGKGPFTLFAPTDEAFSKLPAGTLDALRKDKPKLKALLAYHVVAGRHLSKELATQETLKTLAGGDLRIDATDGVRVNDSKISRADVEATNGVLHAIDALLDPATGGKQAGAESSSLYALTATTLEGKEMALSAFEGKVTLVVNVASACGFTPQYAGLQTLHSELADRGFAVLGFPSNEFGEQEPGDAESIRTYCNTKYGVKFPLFSKVVTKPGEAQSPVYAFLTKGRAAPNWNFCKYLVGKDGRVIEFYESAVTPSDADLRKAIEAALR